MANTPLVRDVLVLDASVQAFYDGFDGDSPVFLLARVVQFDPAFPVLRVAGRPLTILCDEYQGAGGRIDAGGRAKHAADAVPGRDGAEGAPSHPRSAHGQELPPTPGGNGQRGGDGESGYAGVDVTLMCRVASAVDIDTSGTSGAPAGNGGRGARGGDGYGGHQDDDGQVTGAVSGSHGGYGGAGGNGGSGGAGGTLTLLTIAPVASPALRTGGGRGAAAGAGAAFGMDGAYCGDPICTDDSQPWKGADGAWGADGGGAPPQVETLSEEDFKQRQQQLLGIGTDTYWGNFWAPFRLVMGEYHFRRFQPGAAADDGLGRLAAREFVAALEVQPDNAEARRLLALLQGGANALGFQRDFDVVPDFRRYLQAFTDFAPLVTGFLGAGLADLLAAQQLDAVRAVLSNQERVARDALATAQAELAAAQSEHGHAVDEAKYQQQLLDQATADIQAAMDAMKTESFSFGDIIGTVAEVGAAIVSVVAAIPTGGASLVALVPAVASLASALVTEGPPLVQSLFDGVEANVEVVQDAYKKVDADVKAVIGAGKAVINFIDLVQKIAAGSTPQNAQSVALVRRGAELAHQVMVARNQVQLLQQRTDALQARTGRLDGVVQAAAGAASTTDGDAQTVRTLGLQAIEAALSHVDSLLAYVFLAQRSLEIYALPAPSDARQLALDAGMQHPELARRYFEEGTRASALALAAQVQAAWARLLQPIALEDTYLTYLQRGSSDDIVRLSFDAATDPRVQAFRATGILPFRLDVAGLNVGATETKIRGVAIALVGAASPSGVVSCEVWHGGSYEQVGPDGQLAIQSLRPKSTTVPAPIVPLALDGVAFGQDSPVDSPQALSMWGRGAGGEWSLRLPARQPRDEPVDLSGLRTVQVWIGYQYVPPSPQDRRRGRPRP
jgi:hypothetical protein